MMKTDGEQPNATVALLHHEGCRRSMVFARNPNLRMKPRNYASVPLAALIEEIAIGPSVQALTELHNNRTVFATWDEAGLVFVQLLRRLADNAVGDGWPQNEIDAAVSLTTDKFTQMAQSSEGLDCRTTFRAVAAEIQEMPAMDSLTQEVQVAGLLNNCVRRQFKWALKEARRTCTRTRYVWRVRGGEIRLLMPKSVSGNARAKWLMRHVPDVDPYRTGERERVQAAIDSELSAHPIPLELVQVADTASIEPWRALDRVTEDGLAACVAAEKARNVDNLRPAIRALGPERVRELVLTIFESVTDDRVKHTAIAEKFGLDDATLSRFAGKVVTSQAAPDLWRNLAGLLAANVIFRETFSGTRMWDYVQELVLSSSAKPQGR